MASTVSNGNDRSEKWHRPFQMATTVYEREICNADFGFLHMSRISHIDSTFSCNIKHLMTGPEETLRLEGNKINCFPRDQSFVI